MQGEMNPPWFHRWYKIIIADINPCFLSPYQGSSIENNLLHGWKIMFDKACETCIDPKYHFVCKFQIFLYLMIWISPCFKNRGLLTKKWTTIYLYEYSCRFTPLDPSVHEEVRKKMMSMQVNCTGNLGLVCGLLTPFPLLTSYLYIYNLNIHGIAK